MKLCSQKPKRFSQNKDAALKKKSLCVGQPCRSNLMWFTSRIPLSNHRLVLFNMRKKKKKLNVVILFLLIRIALSVFYLCKRPVRFQPDHSSAPCVFSHPVACIIFLHFLFVLPLPIPNLTKTDWRPMTVTDFLILWLSIRSPEHSSLVLNNFMR